jgi:hypothetical protein
MCASRCTKIAMCTLWTSRIKQESRLFIPHMSSTFSFYSFEKCVLPYQVLKLKIKINIGNQNLMSSLKLLGLGLDVLEF